ncbi:MAG: cyclic nucleotide-binding domain-containing protein [Xanthomonadales bacterium]|nr:cyclic nucleotide-binding domain-containing protein [Xanthomonadales bacterium]
MTDNKNFVQHAAGDFIFNEGEEGSVMYIIESGTVEILRRARGAKPLAELESGDFFGEMAILEDQPRFAGARAKTAVRLLRIERAQFADLIQSNFEIAVRIMRKLAARIRRGENQTQMLMAELNDANARLRAAKASAPRSESQQAPTVQAPLPSDPGATKAPPSAAPSGIRLVHRDSGSEFALEPDQSEFLVGRPDPVIGVMPEINLGPLDSKRTLSRRHAKVLCENGKWAVREEVGTTNGTSLNGRRIRTGETMSIQPGDTMRFGAIELEVKALNTENSS